MIYETHAHYDDKKFDTDRVELLSHFLRENNIGKIVNVGASIESSKASIELAEKYEDVYAAIGVHPEDVYDLSDVDMEWIKQQANHKKVVAIGEIGLDYYWCKEESKRQLQRHWFIAQLELARQVGLPVIIHSRDACEDTLDTIKDYNANGIPGIIHCFSYTKEIAREYIKLGWYIGVGGVVTFKNGKKLVETVADIPLERIVLETDCPYMAPEPYRGQRNSSIFLSHVVDKIAEIKGVTPQEVERVTYENALNIYTKSKRN